MLLVQKRLIILTTVAATGVVIVALVLYFSIPKWIKKDSGSPRVSRLELTRTALGRDLFYGLNTGDFTRLKENAEKAVRRRRRVEDFWAALVFAEMKLGNIEVARLLGEKHLSSAQYDSLLSQLYVTSGTDFAAEKGSSRKELILSGYTSRDPVIYERVARMIKDPRLITNAAVLWAEQGEFIKALSLVRNENREVMTSYLPLYLAIDAGEFNEALSFLYRLHSEQHAEKGDLDLIEADLYMWMGDFEKAVSIYKRYIESNPSFSTVPFLNLAWWAAKNDDYKNAETYLVRALEKHPGDQRMYISRISYLYQSGKTDEALSKLADFMDTQPDNWEGILFSLAIPEMAENPAGREAALWNLLNKTAENSKIGRYFSTYSFKEKNYNDLGIILSRYDGYPDSLYWTTFLRGCLNSANGNIEEGITYFHSSLSSKEIWETHYNLALLYSINRDFVKALDHLQEADRILLSTEPKNMAFKRSLIRTLIARIFLYQENFQGGVRELLYALDLDPVNYKARLLLKKIEGR